MKKSHGVLLALVMGVAGFVAGLLTAPKSGKETRNEIVDDGKKVASSAKKTAATVMDKAVELKNRSEEAVTGAKKGFSSPSKKKKK